MKSKLFHRKELGPYVELQNTNIVLLKSLKDVIQITALIAQMKHRSEQVDSYRDATSFSTLMFTC